MTVARSSIPVVRFPRMPTAPVPPSRSGPVAAGRLRGRFVVAVAAALAAAVGGGRAQPADDGGTDPLVTVGA